MLYNKDMENLIKLVSSCTATIVIYLFGGIDIALECLLAGIIFDYITGLIKAFYLKELSSKVGFRGILKKVMILVIVSTSVFIDKLIGAGGFIRSTVMYFFVANEALSILENAGACNVLVPKVLRNAIETLKDKGDKE